MVAISSVACHIEPTSIQYRRMNNLQPSPSDALVFVSRLIPDAWKQVETFRLEAAEGLRTQWPKWCYLPMDAWGWIAQNCPTMGPQRDLSFLVPALGSLGPWRYTQGIYRFHPELQAALLETELGGDLPVEVLLRLPEWCVFVDTGPASSIEGINVDGFFAWLDINSKDDVPRLCLNALIRVTFFPHHANPTCEGDTP